MRRLFLFLTMIICMGTYAQQDTTYYDSFLRLKLPKEKAEIYKVDCKDEKNLKNIARFYTMQNQLIFDDFEFKNVWGGHHIYQQYNTNGNVLIKTESKKFKSFFVRKCFWENGQLKTEENLLEPDSVRKSLTRTGKDTLCLPCLKFADYGKKYGKLRFGNSEVRKYTELYLFIDKNGVIQNIEFAENYSNETKDVILASLNYIKKWTPAYLNGETVDSYIKLGFPEVIEKGKYYEAVALSAYFPFILK